MRGFTRGNGGMMGQAMKMQAMIEDLRKQAAEMQFTGEAGNGAVKVTVSGDNKVLAVHIDPAVVDPEDPAMLEDLVLLATNNAFKIAQDETNKLFSSKVALPPGFSL